MPTLDWVNRKAAEPGPMSQEAFARYVREEVTKWAKVVKDSGAKVE
jgi:tripartite-type tricarboxylate transporter receptor subunit TctC